MAMAMAMAAMAVGDGAVGMDRPHVRIHLPLLLTNYLSINQLIASLPCCSQHRTQAIAMMAGNHACVHICGPRRLVCIVAWRGIAG